MSEWSWLDITAISALSAIIGYFIGAKVTELRMIIKMIDMIAEQAHRHSNGVQALRSKLETITDENAVEVLTEIGDKIGMKILKAESHGDNWYLYDLKGNFVCQGRDAQEAAINFKAVSAPGLRATVLDSSDKVQWRFTDGTAQHGPLQ